MALSIYLLQLNLLRLSLTPFPIMMMEGANIGGHGWFVSTTHWGLSRLKHTSC